MAKEIKLNLPPADDLFSTEENRQDAKREKVYNIPLPEIDDFPGHPFSVRMDDEMQGMVESVRRSGVLTPGVVRQKEDGEFVSGWI